MKEPMPSSPPTQKRVTKVGIYFRSLEWPWGVYQQREGVSIEPGSEYVVKSPMQVLPGSAAGIRVSVLLVEFDDGHRWSRVEAYPWLVQALALPPPPPPPPPPSPSPLLIPRRPDSIQSDSSGLPRIWGAVLQLQAIKRVLPRTPNKLG